MSRHSPSPLLLTVLIFYSLTHASLALASFSISRPSLTERTRNRRHMLMSSLAAKAVTRNVVGKLSPATTTFFLCDIQERFIPLMYNSKTIVSTAQYLTSVANTLSVPIIATQQYPKVFGPTAAACFADGQDGLDSLVDKGHVFDKKKFSMLTDEVKELLTATKKKSSKSKKADFAGRDSVVLFGIEAHVCVQQTCLDLIEMGKDVHVVVDCVSSQQPFDREISLQRMARAGAFLTTAQSLAFMLMESADHPNFKPISKLTVEHMKLPNEFNPPQPKTKTEK